MLHRQHVFSSKHAVLVDASCSQCPRTLCRAPPPPLTVPSLQFKLFGGLGGAYLLRIPQAVLFGVVGQTKPGWLILVAQFSKVVHRMRTACAEAEVGVSGCEGMRMVPPGTSAKNET